MSSYVISKEDYSRAAGFCAGLADAKYLGEPALWMWHYGENRVYTARDYLPAFHWLYRLNARSVMLQYGDDEPENDPDEYRAEYEAARKKAFDMYTFHPQKLNKACDNFAGFIHCMLYQTEDPECERQMKGFVYRLYFAVENARRRRQGIETDWGVFSLDA